MKTYIDIFLAFFRCGIFGFGGGQATIPLIEKEVVETFGWLTIGEFSDAYAFGNTLPGPITTKMSALVGYKVGGILGSAVALVGMVIPSAIAVVLLFSIYLKHKDAKWLQGMMKGVRPVVVVMLGSVLYKIAQKAFIVKTGTGVDMKFILFSGTISIVASILMLKFNVHPIFLIISSLIVGGLFLG